LQRLFLHTYDVFQKRYKEAPAGAFIEAGKLNLPRSNHSAVRLNDGSVRLLMHRR